jgi:mannose-6-phosphate isomerase-like protein (cupin superfamily)
VGHSVTPNPRKPVHTVLKPWGREIWIVNNDLYCGKILEIEPGKRFSMHMHMQKKETWYLQSGELKFLYIDTETGELQKTTMQPGDCVDIEPGQPHQLECTSESKAVIFEVSTRHYDEDSYRMWR